MASGDLTAWVAIRSVVLCNLTSGETGIGNWTKDQFVYALREGKFKGLAGSGELLPPVP
jgi:hypothetical protein